MGMAASQARFLGLTARQTNLQFEGQQINQQRTSLSNQSANCYNSLLAMNVPVPPSTDDYTKLVYTFTPTISTTANIDQVFANVGASDYKVVYTEFGTKEGIVSTMNKAKITEGGASSTEATLDGNSRKFRTVTTTIGSQADLDAFGETVYTISNGIATPATNFASGTAYFAIAYMANGVECTDVTEGLQNFTNSDLDTSEYLQYKIDDVCYYIKKAEASSALNTLNKISVYATGSVTVGETTTDNNALIDYDSNSRISTITIHRNGVPETYTVTTNTEIDEEAYDNAYNQYIYEQYLYDQEQNRINASIEIIQAEDKNLELRLKQLDTENNAISTEIEAVKKVLSNNVESSFKTFNA